MIEGGKVESITTAAESELKTSERMAIESPASILQLVMAEFTISEMTGIDPPLCLVTTVEGVRVGSVPTAVESGLGGSGSGIGRSSTYNGSKTPKPIVSCLERLNIAMVQAKCVSFISIATFLIGVIAGHNC